MNIDGQTDGRKDGQIDRQTDRLFKTTEVSVKIEPRVKQKFEVTRWQTSQSVVLF